MKKSVLFGVLIVAMLFGVVGLASAGSATFTGSASADNSANRVLVSAKVNPKISLTVATPDTTATANCWVNFGAVDPGVTGGKTVNLTVSSNKQFDMTSTQDTTAFGGITLTRVPGQSWSNVGKGKDVALSDGYSIDVPWTTDPGDYDANVQYTVTQD